MDKQRWDGEPFLPPQAIPQKNAVRNSSRTHDRAVSIWIYLFPRDAEIEGHSVCAIDVRVPVSYERATLVKPGAEAIQKMMKVDSDFSASPRKAKTPTRESNARAPCWPSAHDMEAVWQACVCTARGRRGEAEV